MRKVLVFGTFDIFHEGHKSFLQQAKKYGDQLVVVISRDETILKIKGQAAINKEDQRLKVIKQSGLVDEVLLGNIFDKHQVIKKIRPEVICLGYDQKFFVDMLDKKIKEYGLNIEIYTLKPFKPEIYKSSKLKLSNIKK